MALKLTNYCYKQIDDPNTIIPDLMPPYLQFKNIYDPILLFCYESYDKTEITKLIVTNTREIENYVILKFDSITFDGIPVSAELKYKIIDPYMIYEFAYFRNVFFQQLGKNKHVTISQYVIDKTKLLRVFQKFKNHSTTQLFAIVKKNNRMCFVNTTATYDSGTITIEPYKIKIQC